MNWRFHFPAKFGLLIPVVVAVLLITGVEALRDELRAKGLQGADKETDYKRGVELLFVMAGVFAVAAGLATSLSGGGFGDAVLVSVFVGSVNNAILCTRSLTRA